MTPEQFLDSATCALQKDCITEDNDAAFRSAVHAAYYAAYHLLAQRLSLDVSDRQQANHAALRREALRCGASNPDIGYAGNRIELLERLRARADYDLAAPLTRQQATGAVELAKSIFAALRP